MGCNSVVLQGTVKRDAKAHHVGENCFVIDFGISVWSETAKRFDIFDCRILSGTDAYDFCQGVLNGGDKITVEGMLQKRTTTSEGKIGGKYIEIKSTDTVVLVENILESF